MAYGSTKAIIRSAYTRVGPPNFILERDKIMFPENSYDTGPFTDVASTWGEQLWAFLNDPSVIASMINASDIGSPAAESVATALIHQFGDSIKRDRVKQFIGFLIRQVMERNGYKHTSYGHHTKLDFIHC
jgi:hypothetical protein